MKLHFEAGVPGADPTLPDVSVSINRTEYQLAYDFAAIAAAEKLTGINLLAAAVENPSFTGTAALLYAAMHKAHPEVTLEQAQGLVDLRNIFPVLQAVRAAWGASVPEAESEEGEAGEEETQAELSPEV